MRNALRWIGSVVAAGGCAAVIASIALSSSDANDAGAVKASGTVPAGSPPGLTDTRRPMLDGYGIQPSQTKAAGRTKSGKELFVSRRKDVVCVTTDDHGSGHCAPPELLAEGKGFGGEYCVLDLPDSLVRITGILPDGATKATLRAGGQTWDAAATEGVVGFEIPRKLAGGSVEISWNGPSAATTSQPQPNDITTAVCG